MRRLGQSETEETHSVHPTWHSMCSPTTWRYHKPRCGRRADRKGNVKLSQCTDNVIAYIRNLKEFTKKLLELTCEFNSHRMQDQYTPPKLIVFLDSGNK